jgi:hypothetical protein
VFEYRVLFIDDGNGITFVPKNGLRKSGDYFSISTAAGGEETRGMLIQHTSLDHKKLNSTSNTREC